MRTKRLSIIVTILTVFGLMLAACGTGAKKDGGAQGVDQKLIVGQQSEESTLDANLIVSGSGYNVILNVHDTLMWHTSQKLEPALAESFESVSPTQWKVVLRKGVKWHNGTPFTAADVKFTIDRTNNVAFKSSQISFTSAIKNIDVKDDYTLIIDTKTPEPTLPDNLLMVPIVSKQYVEEKGADYVASHPMGTGPFKFKEWIKGDRVVLEANPDYWRGKPQLSTLTFRTIPEAASLVSALEAGEVDIIVGASPDQAEVLKKSANLKVEAVPSQRSIVITLNTLEAPYNKKQVRQAMNYAVDKKGIVDNILLGYGGVVPTFHAEVYRGYNKDLKPYPYDPAKAKQLLAEAGYPQGFKGRLVTPQGRYPKDKEVSEAIAANLKAVGIDLTVEVMEWGHMLDLYRTHGLTMPHMMGYGVPVWDAGVGFRSRFGCKSSSSYYCNEQVEKLIDQGNAETDMTKRAQAFEQINALIYEDASHLFLYQQLDIYISRKRVTWTPRSDERVWLYGASISK